MKKVIYTSIIGGYDDLTEPSVIPADWDFICFTDRDLKSDVWEIRKVLPLYTDNTRTARKYKILPHRFLSDYDVSIWVDGNFLVRDNVNELLKFLDEVNMVTYDHFQTILDSRNCVYEEGKTLLFLGEKNMKLTPERGMKNYKDKPEIIVKQLKKYEASGYPKVNGLLSSGIILRSHNKTDVKKTMEYWWQEVKVGSKRDQLSFNYSAWKNNFNFLYFDGDIRDNKYFKIMGAHTGKK